MDAKEFTVIRTNGRPAFFDLSVSLDQVCKALQCSFICSIRGDGGCRFHMPGPGAEFCPSAGSVYYMDMDGAPLPEDREAPKKPKKPRRSATGGEHSWTSSTSSVAMQPVDDVCEQDKISTTVLTSLRIDQPFVADRDKADISINLENKNLEWVARLFLHRRFRFPTRAQERVKDRLDPQTVLAHFHLDFEDGEYLLDFTEAFRFSTNDEHFNFCLDQVVRLMHDGLPEKSQGEGSWEMELYVWLYSCFVTGCSNDLERAWRGTLIDREFPRAPIVLAKMTKQELKTLCEQLMKSKGRPKTTKTSPKIWRPDGIVGYTASVINAFPKQSRQKLFLSEGVHLGLVAIEHKKSEDDISDINMLCYEMHLLCKKQILLGICNPLSFGIYWAGSRFLLYCMEVRGSFSRQPQYVPHLLLQLDADKDDHLILIFRAMWYLRLHGLQTAQLARQNPKLFLKEANVYHPPESEGSDGDQRSEGSKEGERGDGDQGSEGNDGDKDGEKGDGGQGSEGGEGSKGDYGGSKGGEGGEGSKGNGKGKRGGNRDEVFAQQARPAAHEESINAEEAVEGIERPPRVLVTTERPNNVQKYAILPKTLSKGRRTQLRMGRNTRTGELVVLKWWRKDRTHSLDIEESALRRLQGCSGVVKLLDKVYDPLKKRSVLVLEYIDAEASYRFATPGKATPARIRYFFHQLLQILRECQHHQVVHHDVKPHNVLITQDMRVVLIDFDHALCLDEPHYYQPKACTPGFTPPELPAVYFEVDHTRVDVWSVGIMLLYFMLWIAPLSDEAAYTIVEQLHSAPPGQVREHMVQWIESTPDDELEEVRLFGPDDVGGWEPPPWCSEEGLALAQVLLTIDPDERPTLDEALCHPFFVPACF